MTEVGHIEHCGIRILQNRKQHWTGLVTWTIRLEPDWACVGWLKVQIFRAPISSRTFQELKNALLDEWHVVPQNWINTLAHPKLPIDLIKDFSFYFYKWWFNFSIALEMPIRHIKDFFFFFTIRDLFFP